MKQFLVFLCVVVLFAAEIVAVDRTNFVIIMADDMGYADASCYGGTAFATPHIDALATAGMRFTDYHSNGPVCSPTRAALVTGRYQQRAGVVGVINADPAQNRHHGLQVSEKTFAELLASAGYTTGMCGKWHLGYQPKYNPVRHGFGSFRGYVSGNIDYMNHLDRMGVLDWWRADQIDDELGYSTHLITKHAVEFIRQNHELPFCLYVAHEAPHTPFQGPNDRAFRRLGMVVGENRSDEDRSRAYREMVQEMDKGVGAIVAELDRYGLGEQTLVVFCSDNGATKWGSNSPLRGHKGSLWEGGIRVPAIVRWTGRVAAGTESHQVAASMDWMPTMLEAAGILPAGHDLDGVSLLASLDGDKPAHRKLFWSYGNQRAMRDGDWKLVVRGKNRSPALFDLSRDLREQTDVAGEYRQRAKQMSREIMDWFAEVSQQATPQPE